MQLVLFILAFLTLLMLYFHPFSMRSYIVFSYISLMFVYGGM